MDARHLARLHSARCLAEGDLVAKSDIEKQLQELDRLLGRGVVNEEEYAERRRAVISAPPAAVPQKKRGGIFKYGFLGCLGILVAVGLLLLVVIVVIAVAAGNSGGDQGADVHVALAEGSSGVIWPGKESDRKAKVTILKILDGATSSNPVVRSAQGKRFYAIQVEVEAVGTKAARHLAWKARDAADGESDNILRVGVGGEPLEVLGDLTPGGKIQGWVVFEIPAEAGVKWVRADPNIFVRNDLYFDAP
jgi:hypothetical protein